MNGAGAGGPAPPSLPRNLIEPYRTAVVEVEVDGSLRAWDEVPRPDGTRIHVITAHNPGSERRPAGENRAANARLEAALRTRGYTYLPAVNRAPDGGWEEEAFAVMGAPREEILALGRTFGQLAVYEIGDRGREVLACPGQGGRDPGQRAGPRGRRLSSSGDRREPGSSARTRAPSAGGPGSRGARGNR